MFRKQLLEIVRPEASEPAGLAFISGVERDGMVMRGRARSNSGHNYEVKNGYLDLLEGKRGASNLANLTNFAPGAGRFYEPVWRTRSLSLLTGGSFPNEREVELVAEMVELDRAGTYLDLGCSAGLYTRNMEILLDEMAADAYIIGIDIAPVMLQEAVKRSLEAEAMPSFARADAHVLPFANASFAGVVCGGTLNELGDPATALKECARVLVPGGRMAIMGIMRSSKTRGTLAQRLLATGGVRFFTREELDGLLHNAGFEIETLRTYGPVFFAAAQRRYDTPYY